MNRITIKEYRAAKGGDYDRYTLSNGEVYWLWLKAPFKGGEMALVHIVTDDDKEIGTVTVMKDINRIVMSLNGQRKEARITINQYLRPNKKYIFDKIVRAFLVK